MHSSITTAVHHAYEQITDDTKFVRLTTVTTIIHSIIFLVIVGMNVYRFASQNSEQSGNFGAIIQYIETMFPRQELGGVVVVIALILAIGYFLMPPIGEATLIHYLDDTEKQGGKSLAKGLTSFFPMFEFDGIITVFTPHMFLIFFSRFWMLGILDNIFVLIIAVLRAFLVLFATVFLSFAKYFIVLDDMKPFDAMKKSMSVALTNLPLALRATFLQYVLSMRFIINIAIFLGMPLLILYGAMKLNITNAEYLGTILIGVSIVTGLLTAYINGIIEAFFITLRYRLFVQIKG